MPTTLFMKVNKSCRSCSAPLDAKGLHSGSMDRLLSRRAHKYYSKTGIKKWAKAAFVPIKPGTKVNKGKKYFIKFHKGATLKLWYRDKLSTMRVPDRFTSRVVYLR